MLIHLLVVLKLALGTYRAISNLEDTMLHHILYALLTSLLSRTYASPITIDIPEAEVSKTSRRGRPQGISVHAPAIFPTADMIRVMLL